MHCKELSVIIIFVVHFLWIIFYYYFDTQTMSNWWRYPFISVRWLKGFFLLRKWNLAIKTSFWVFFPFFLSGIVVSVPTAGNEKNILILFILSLLFVSDSFLFFVFIVLIFQRAQFIACPYAVWKPSAFLQFKFKSIAEMTTRVFLHETHLLTNHYANEWIQIKGASPFKIISMGCLVVKGSVNSLKEQTEAAIFIENQKF